MMKNLAMIACISADSGLGYHNELLWHFSDDMKFFRETTLGAVVVMGSKTFASIGQPLPKRRNVVLSRGKIAGAVETIHSEETLRQYLNGLDETAFIIGGASLYRMFINDTAKLYLTEVAATKPADTYFPEFRREDFRRKVLAKHKENGVNYQIIEYTRKALHD